MNATDVIIDDLLRAEQKAEAKESVGTLDETAEDPSLESSSQTERTGIDDASAVTAPPGEEMPSVRAPGLVNISHILGVPLFYERVSNPGPRQFPVASSFRPVLEAIVAQVQERAPAGFGPLQRISSAGMFVAKPGAHGQGRGCDWDRLVFANLEISPIDRDHRSPSLAKRMRYWSFGAVCRSNCAFVLHGLYNAEHADHYHTDNITGIAFTRHSQATVKLLQAVLNDIFGHTPTLETDGDFGPKSREAFGQAMHQLHLTGSIDDVNVWTKFLRRSARLGFERSMHV
jgi:hypothetical protein